MDGGSTEDSQDALPIPDNFSLEPTNVDEAPNPSHSVVSATDNVDNGSECHLCHDWKDFTGSFIANFGLLFTLL